MATIAQAEGDLPRAVALLAPLHPGADNSGAVEVQVYQAILERRPAQIISRLKEILAKPDPALGYLNGELALTNMGLDDKAAALALSEQAIAVNPIEKDAIVGPIPIEILARVAAGTGEPDRAIAALQKLLSIPYAGALGGGTPLTPALLRLDPMFDPLRNEPRFQKLVASPAPKNR
jgi:serine/threonine-protein kinase